MTYYHLKYPFLYPG